MSLFAKPPVPVVPASVRLNHEINLLRRTPRQLADTLFRGWSMAFDLLWSNANGITPADRIAALGTDAAELFNANTALVEMMLGVIGDSDPAMTAAIQQRVAALPAYTVNEDGTVTL